MLLLLACRCFFFFNDTATTEIYTLSLHDALPIWDLVLQPACLAAAARPRLSQLRVGAGVREVHLLGRPAPADRAGRRSEEHTSELQSRQYLVCRLLLEKKKKIFFYFSLIHYIIDF